MLQVAVTDALRAFLEVHFPDFEHAELIEVDTLLDLHDKYLKKEENPDQSLSALLEGTTIAKSDIPKSSEQDELDVVRAKSSERQYQRALGRSGLNSRGQEPLKTSEWKEGTRYMSLATSFLISFFAAFLSGYYLVEVATSFGLTVRLIVGLAVAMTTLILETVLFIVREQKRRS